MARDKEKKKKKTRGAKKVRKATQKQRRKKISKSGKPKGEENKAPPFHFLRTSNSIGEERGSMYDPALG